MYNLFNYALFTSTDNSLIIAGSVKKIDATITKEGGGTSTQSVLNLMKAVGLVFGVSLNSIGTTQSYNCFQSTVAFTSQSALSSSSATLTDLSALIPLSSTTSSVIIDTSTSVIGLLSTTVIAPLCSITSTFTYQPVTLTDQIYNVGTGDLTQYQVPAFSLTQDCSDTKIYYKATLSGGTSLPSFITFNQELLVLDWSAAVSANVGSYLIQITGYIGTGFPQTSTMTLTINAACSTSVITASKAAEVIDVFLNVAAPVSTFISLPTFTSSTSVAECGSFQYSVTYLSGTALDSQTYTYPYLGNISQMMIQGTQQTLDGTTDRLVIKGWQSDYTTQAASSTLDVNFMSVCNTAFIVAPSSISFTYTVGSGATTLAIPTMTTNVYGCETTIVYGCSDCTQLPPTINQQGQAPQGVMPSFIVDQVDNSHIGTYQFTIQGTLVTPSIAYQVLSVTILPDCTQVTIAGNQISSITVDVNEPPQTKVLSIVSWDAQFAQCTSLLAYKFVDDFTGTTPDLSLFALNPDGRLLFHESSLTSSKARVYNLTVTGYMPSVGTKPNAQVKFSVTVTDLCLQAKLLPVEIANQSYTLGAQALQITVPGWSTTYPGLTCGQITYSVVNMDGSPLDSSVFTFDQNSNSLSVYTMDGSQAGLRQLTVVGSLLASGWKSYFPLSINIIDPCSSAIITTTSVPNTVYMIGSAQTTLTFGEWKESLGTCGAFKYQVRTDPTPQISPFTFSEASRTFIIQMASGLTLSQVLKVNITGTLACGLSATSMFTLTLQPPYPVDPAIAQSPEKLEAYMKKMADLTPTLKASLKVDTNGVATITFTKSMSAVSNITLLSEYNALSFVVNPKSSGGKVYQIENWQALSLGGTTLKVQLTFPNPAAVSVSTVSLKPFISRTTIRQALPLKSQHTSQAQISSRLYPWALAHLPRFLPRTINPVSIIRQPLQALRSRCKQHSKQLVVSL